MKSLKIIAFLSLLVGVFSINEEDNDVEYLCPMLDTYFHHTEDNFIGSKTTPSVQECSEWCSSNPECKGWTHGCGSWSFLQPYCSIYRYDAGIGFSECPISGTRGCYPDIFKL